MHCASYRPRSPSLSPHPETFPARSSTPLRYANRLHFPLPPPDTKLAAIRHQLAEYTQLPAQSFKLIHAGAVMKDDNAPCKLRFSSFARICYFSRSLFLGVVEQQYLALLSRTQYRCLHVCLVHCFAAMRPLARVNT